MSSTELEVFQDSRVELFSNIVETNFLKRSDEPRHTPNSGRQCCVPAVIGDAKVELLVALALAGLVGLPTLAQRRSERRVLLVT